MFYLIKYHATKMYGGVELLLQVFLTLTLDGDEWLASRPGRFTPGKERTYWIRWWVGSRAGMDEAAKKENPCPYRESNPGHPGLSLVTLLTELSG
jgi:hypothetical protein